MFQLNEQACLGLSGPDLWGIAALAMGCYVLGT